MTKTTKPPFPREVRERAVRLVLEQRGEHPSQWTAISSVAAKIGCSGETLRNWVRRAERDSGVRPGPTTAETERIKALEREVRELRQVNEVLRKASGAVAQIACGGDSSGESGVIAGLDEQARSTEIQDHELAGL